MDNIYKTSELVQQILAENSAARNSDDYLYSLVCEILAREIGVDYASLLHRDVLLERKAFGFPHYTTVSRARRKLQSKYPDLAGTDDVKAERAHNENAYKEYARS